MNTHTSCDTQEMHISELLLLLSLYYSIICTLILAHELFLACVIINYLNAHL